MAQAIPFGERLETVSIPPMFRITRSLTSSKPCTFTVINFRDEATHEVLVRVTTISRRRFSGGEMPPGQYEIKGDILKVDDKDWAPPFNRFRADYEEDNPRRSRFSFLEHA